MGRSKTEPKHLHKGNAQRSHSPVSVGGGSVSERRRMSSRGLREEGEEVGTHLADRKLALAQARDKELETSQKTTPDQPGN